MLAHVKCLKCAEHNTFRFTCFSPSALPGSTELSYPPTNFQIATQPYSDPTAKYLAHVVRQVKKTA